VPLREVTAAVAKVLAGDVSRWAIAVTAGNRALLGALFATMVVTAADALADGAAGYVLTAGITGLATFAGTCASPTVANRTPPRLLVVAAFGIPAAVLGAAALAANLAVAVPAVAICFFVFQIMRVVADSTVQSCIPDATRGRVFAAYDVAYNLSYFGGAAMALMVDQTTELRTLLVIVALAYTCGSALVAVHDRVVVSRPAVAA
jgi:predicted MFS family arabinose efflux permease